MEHAADPKWEKRWLQTRYQSKQDYYSYCDNEARSWMKLAKGFEGVGQEEAAENAREWANRYKAEMEEILKNG